MLQVYALNKLFRKEFETHVTRVRSIDVKIDCRLTKRNTWDCRYWCRCSTDQRARYQSRKSVSSISSLTTWSRRGMVSQMHLCLSLSLDPSVYWPNVFNFALFSAFIDIPEMVGYMRHNYEKWKEYNVRNDQFFNFILASWIVLHSFLFAVLRKLEWNYFFFFFLFYQLSFFIFIFTDFFEKTRFFQFYIFFEFSDLN